ncbi:peroxisomal membrane protein 2 [Cimex lectularius]|uniref:Peroxisomal membrane protein 2 n=1 Tax=Cimex lectularius TaxID=79782 RepID=A0A8I6SNU6_CIMLE|nr:peroxisomal membrane protein 2 [Cimex lectularius]
MSLSKLPVELSMKYLIVLYSDPIRTKSISSCVIASLGNVVSQCIAGAFCSKNFDFNNLRAHALFGLIFGGTVPHYFFKLLDDLVAQRSKYGVMMKLLIERLIYAPFYHILSLYMLAIFQGKSHDEAVQNTKKQFLTLLKANWKFITVLQFINLKFVHPMFRVLILNFIWLFWGI